ncbi:MEKHLA domain-containing protein [Methylobacillus flagellatus]|uniref:PAS domain S-box protein n=1 Tax=Methylobacillus flagellatus TaxID=405 RepID=UPI002853E289|nr:PAS domain S-box protein [Methylobacillus flagellatus]MDR5171678.1 MEKHLA domain-containing protein [Methylobacillus flagellatus]
MSLRVRFNLLITTLLLMLMVAVGYVVIKGMRISTEESVEAATRVTVQLLDTVIINSRQNPEWGYTHDVMHTFLQSLGHVRSSEIFLYNAQGELMYQSPPSTYRANETPPRWFARMVEPEPEVVSRRIRFGMLVVASDAAGAIRESWASFQNLLWIETGFFFVLNALIYWMLGRWLRPANDILKAISEVEQGNLDVRLPRFKVPEFSRIAQNFNLMGESLRERTEENRRLALIVQQSADAIMIHDLNGNISFWNPAAQRMFGYAPADIIGRSAELLMPPNHESELERNMANMLANGLVEHYDTQRVARDGKLLDVSLSAAPLMDPKTGEVIGEICSMRDITERKLAEETARKLEENRQLTHLIQRHIEDERRSLARELHDELGQYVTAIKTFAVAIANKTRQDMPSVESSAQTIVSAANHIYDGMHNIIRHLRPGSLDNLGLSEALRDAVADWQAQNPNVKFNLELHGKLDLLGESLNINLYRIVQESVTNALRHARADRIDISLSRHENGTLTLLIKDNGIGMNMCNVDQSRHFGLLGMRERTQALYGSFSIDSLPGQGSAILVTIPERVS